MVDLLSDDSYRVEASLCINIDKTIFGPFLQPSWRAKPASWAVLRLFWITCVYIYIFIYVCALWISSLLVVYDAIDNASSSRATRTEN